MNINICKVNTRYIILCVFVAFLLVALIVNVKNVSAQTPTLNPTEAEHKRRSDIHEKLEEARSRYVHTGLSQEQLKMQSTKEIWSILGRLFSGIDEPISTPTPGFLLPPGSTPLTPELQSSIPQGETPPGRCTDLVNQALVNLGNHPSNLEVYKQAGIQTGVPWEAIAAIHYIETGGSFNPNGSCISGRAIGAQEPDNGNQTYGSLLETCVAAAEEFKGKTGMVNHVVGKNGMSTPNAYQMLAGQFASYNSPTQSECAMGGPIGNYDFIYTGSTWPGIPDIGQCRPKGEKFVGDRHIYATACLDASHENMWFHFHYGGKVQLYTNRVGAITLIRGIQKVYSQSPNSPNYTPGPTYPPPSGLRRSPRDAETIVSSLSNVLVDGASCGNSVHSGNVDSCVAGLGSSVSSRLTGEMTTSAKSYTYLQCVGFARALAYEIDGKPGGYGNACAQARDSENYRFLAYPYNAPAPGDMVVFCRGYASVGHIAYISQVMDPNNFKVAEAHMNGIGGVSVRNVGANNNIQGYLRMK
jgi:surface antigen